ncbi:MAG TPA: 30S ribosomal protein S13 [Nitrososphaerales archaeon]
MSQDFRFIVRMAGRDLQGTQTLAAALADLKGVGFNLATYILAERKIDPRSRVGSLSDNQIADLEKSVKDIAGLKLPTYLLNKQKDMGTGANMHLIGSDLDFAIRNGIEMEKNMQSWRGIRHFLGLKVRGQRTRTTGRKGRTVGVKKVKMMRGGGPAQTATQAPAAPKKEEK